MAGINSDVFAEFNDLTTTALNAHAKEFKNIIENHNALYAWIMKRGHKRKVNGGLSIVQNLDVLPNSTYQRYSGYDYLDIGPSEFATAAQFLWKQAAVHVAASGAEIRNNKGETQLVDLVESRVTNAIRTAKNNFTEDLYSDGTLPNQIGGLQFLISDTGIGTVGGIDASSYSWWQNKVQNAAAPLQGGGAVTVSPTTIEFDIMHPLYMELIRGNDQCDLIIADSESFRMFEQSQVSMKRYTSSDTATGGFQSLKYKGADVLFDNAPIPARHMYFINSDTLYLAVHPDADWTKGDAMRPVNQDASIIPILFQGNLTMSNRKLNGVAYW